VAASGAVAALLFGGCAAPGPERAFLEGVRLHPDRSAWVKGVRPFVRDGASADYAALATVVRHWRKPGSPEEIARWFKENGLWTLSSGWVFRYAAGHRLWACRSRGTVEDIAVRLRCGVPVMVTLQSNALNAATRRQAVVVGYNHEARALLCFDGGRIPTLYAAPAFESAWRAQDDQMMVVCPPERATWTLTPEERASRAEYYELKQQHTEAARDYETALAAGLDRAEMYVGLGNSLRGLNRAGEAEAAYRKAIAADPHLSRAYNNLAYLLAEAGRSPDEAVALARQALLLDPANALPMDTLGFALYQLGRYQEAADMLERARARSQGASVETQIEIGMHLVWAHHKGGQDHLARQVLADLRKLKPRLEVPRELLPLLKPPRPRR
jgi:tetratricopeptide (TPR) repeat protein